MNIYLIRHGRQSSSDCNVNVDLAPEGERQAALLGQRMKNYPVDALYCSDLIRAEQTAKIAFAGQPALLEHLQIRPGLAEVDFGELTGQPDAVVKRFYDDYYQEQMDRFAEGRVQKGNALDEVNEFIGDFFVPTEEIWYPQGETGESVLARVMPVIQEWIEYCRCHTWRCDPYFTDRSFWRRFCKTFNVWHFSGKLQHHPASL